MCTSPLRVYTKGFKSNGKKDIKIVGKANTNNEVIFVRRDNSNVFDAMSFAQSFRPRFDSGHWRRVPSSMVPCGSCIECRLRHAQDWATRVMMEMETCSSAYFVTLTYNDEFLPESSCKDGISSLKKRDLQLFIKRLRKRFPDVQVRYLASGEYGSKSARPHYHAIFFNLPLPADSFVFYKRSSLGDNLYFNYILSDLWSKGYVIVGDVTFQSASYVARYTLKKHKGNDKSFYDEYGIEPEFCLMSLKPAIGLRYLEEHQIEIIENGYIQLSEGRRCPIPRYFYDKLSLIYPDEISDIKKRNEDNALTVMHTKMNDFSSDYFDDLSAKSSLLKSKTSCLSSFTF